MTYCGENSTVLNSHFHWTNTAFYQIYSSIRTMHNYFLPYKIDCYTSRCIATLNFWKVYFVKRNFKNYLKPTHNRKAFVKVMRDMVFTVDSAALTSTTDYSALLTLKTGEKKPKLNKILHLVFKYVWKTLSLMPYLNRLHLQIHEKVTIFYKPLCKKQRI